MKTWIKITGIILILFFAGCTKEDDLKLPVRTNMIMRINPYYLDVNKEINEFQLIESKVSIQKIEFEGIREAGENVFFETDPDTNLSIVEVEAYIAVNTRYKGYDAAITDFDLPQGIYRSIRIDIYLNEISDNEITDNDEVDSPNIGWVITGKYGHWKDYDEYFFGFPDFSFPIVFVVDSNEKFIFRTMQEVVMKQPESEIVLNFNIIHAFYSLDYKLFEEAEISGDSTDQKIIISNNQNKDLYDMLLYRLGMNTTMVVN